MPQNSTKNKDASKKLGIARDSNGKHLLVKSKPPGTATSPSLTKHKDAPQPPKEVVRDLKSRKPALVKPNTRSTNVPQKSTKRKHASKLFEELNLRRDSKGSPTLVKSETRSEKMLVGDSSGHNARKVTTKGSGQDGGVSSSATSSSSIDKGHSDEDSDKNSGESSDESSDEEDAAGVQTGGWGPAGGRPAEVGADGGRDGGQYADSRIVVEEEPSAAHAARRVAARGYAAERHFGNEELIIRGSDRARRDDARGDADGRGVPTRQSNRSDRHRRPPVELDYVWDDDDSPAVDRPGVPRKVIDESILDRMPPLEVGDDGDTAGRYRVLDPESTRWERQQRLAPLEGWAEARHWSARERADWQLGALAGQPHGEQYDGGRHYGGQHHGRRYHGGQHRGGQGYYGQGYHEQDYHGQGYHEQDYHDQAHSGQVGQGRGYPPPAYTRYDQRHIGLNSYY